jgi:elongator complex protein 3
MVEIGVQSVFDEILEKNETGLNAEKIARATKILKDAGFKVLYHLMPNLMGSNPNLDKKCFEIVFSDERFKPDWIKIYPTVVTKESSFINFGKKENTSPTAKKN